MGQVELSTKGPPLEEVSAWPIFFASAAQVSADPTPPARHARAQSNTPGNSLPTPEISWTS